MSPHHRRALTLSIGLAALLYLGVVLFTDRDAVLAALHRVGAPVLVAIFALSLLNYLLRFWRWQRYIAAFGHSLPWRRHFLYYLAGFTLTVTPGKAGEAVRSLYLHGHGVSYAQSLAALFVERLLDVLAMSLLALLILLARPDYAWLVVIARKAAGLGTAASPRPPLRAPGAPAGFGGSPAAAGLSAVRPRAGRAVLGTGGLFPVSARP